VAENYRSSCSIYGIYVEGGGWLKISNGERRLVENIRIPSYWGRESKFAKKKRIP